jgi:mannosyltransferase
MIQDFSETIYSIAEKGRKPILLAIVLLAFAVQLYNLGHKSLYMDEALSAVLSSSLGLKELLASPDKPHPLLYYVILHFFLYLGKSEFFVRLPSVIFSALCIPLVYRLGKDFFDFRVGLLSAFLLATSPMLYWYAQEARMYTLLILFSLLSVIFFFNAIRRNEARLWIGFIASTSLNIYTHYFAFLGILIQFIFIMVFIKKYRIILGRFIASLVIVFALFIPQLINFYSGFLSKTELGATWGYTPALLLSSIFYQLASGKVCDSFQNSAAILFLAIFLYGLCASWRSYREETVLSMIWVFAPILIAFLMAFKIDMDVKYIIFILPVYLIIISKGLLIIKKKKFTIFFILIIIILIFNIYFLYENYNQPKADWRSASSFIKDKSFSEGPVLVFPLYQIWPLEYYGLDSKRILWLDIEYGEDFVSRVQEISLRNPMMWIIYTPNLAPRYDQQKILIWLDKNCVKKYDTTMAKFYLYEPNSSRTPPH